MNSRRIESLSGYSMDSSFARVPTSPSSTSNTPSNYKLKNKQLAKVFRQPLKVNAKPNPSSKPAWPLYKRSPTLPLKDESTASHPLQTFVSPRPPKYLRTETIEESKPYELPQSQSVSSLAPQQKVKTWSSYHKKYLKDTHDSLKGFRSMQPIPNSEIASRKVTLPNQPTALKTVIFDLDETLVHCCEPGEPSDIVVTAEFHKGRPETIGINVRPFAYELLEEAKRRFEVVVFTASHQSYADPVLNALDPEHKFIDYRLYRDSCILTSGIYVKDLRIIQNRKLSNMVIVDNLAHSFLYQLSNGIPILSWYDDKEDRELAELLEYLKRIALVSDVRVPNNSTFKLNSMFLRK